MTESNSLPVTRRLPRHERRAQLLVAAATTFLRGGYDGTSMEDVAEAAGVTRLIVYRVFGSKAELYRAVLASVIERLRTEFEGIVPDADGRMRISERMLRVARADADGFRLLWRHAEREPLFAAEAQEFGRIVTDVAMSLLERYLADPVFRRWAAVTLVAHVREGTCNWLDEGDPALDDEFVVRMGAGLRSLVAAWS